MTLVNKEVAYLLTYDVAKRIIVLCSEEEDDFPDEDEFPEE